MVLYIDFLELRKSIFTRALPCYAQRKCYELQLSGVVQQLA